MKERLGTERLWLLTGITLAALVVFAIACGGGDGGNGDQPDLACGSPPSDSGSIEVDDRILTVEDILAKDQDISKTEVVEWGYMFERSGPLAGFGEPAGDGVLMAVQEINDAGGFQVGDTLYTIDLIEFDTKTDVGETLAVATQLVRDDGVCVVFGPATIGDAETSQVTQPLRVINICPCPEREITTLEDVETMQSDARWAFQTLSAPSKFLPPGALNTRETYPEFETFATVCANSQIGQAFCGFFADAYTAAGFELVAEELVPVGTVDFNPVLTRLRSKEPDIVLNFVDAGTAQFAFLKSAWQLDVGEFHIAVELPLDLFEALVGEGIRDKIVSAGAAPRGHAMYTSDDARDFFEDTYKPFAGGDLDGLPGAFTALTTYDPVFMLVAAMQQAGTVQDTTMIVEALEQIHFDGIGEDDLFFDERHVIVTGNDTCLIYQGEMECTHVPPAD